MNLRDYYLKFYDKHNGRHKYLKKPEHEKKTLSDKEKRKREWREHKKLRRDRARGRAHFNWSALYRDENSRSHRRWVRGRIKEGDYDLSRGWKKDRYFNVDWVW